MTLIAPELLEILRCTMCHEPLSEQLDRVDVELSKRPCISRHRRDTKHAPSRVETSWSLVSDAQR